MGKIGWDYVPQSNEANKDEEARSSYKDPGASEKKQKENEVLLSSDELQHSQRNMGCHYHRGKRHFQSWTLMGGIPKDASVVGSLARARLDVITPHKAMKPAKTKK